MKHTNQNPEPVREFEKVSDAVEQSWVDHRAPSSWRPYLRLSRADRPIGAWLLLLPCWWSLPLAIADHPGSLRTEDIWIAAACWIGAFLMRGAGCSWNDFMDQRVDAQVRRTRSRPLPSGQVTSKQALLWMAIQALLAFFVLLTFNTFSIWLGIISLLPVAIYPMAKRFTWWPQLFLGVAFNWGALLAWSAHTASLAVAPFLIYLSGIFWTLFYDTIYAHQDREDDGVIGVRSTARLLGGRTKFWLRLFAGFSVLFLLAAVYSIELKPGALAMAFAGVMGFGLHLLWQLRRLDIDSPATCLMLFRSNRNAGLIPAPFFAAAIFAG